MKPTMRLGPAGQRQTDLSMIHIAKKQLALGDDSYRDLLERLTGKRSSGDLDGNQRRAVLEEFKRLGFQRQAPKQAPAHGTFAKHPRIGTRRLADDARARKVRALWLTLWHLAAVRDPSENALAAFVKRIARVDDLAWLSPQQFHAVTEALKDWCEREGFAVHQMSEDATNADWNRALVRAIWAKRTALEQPGAAIDEYFFGNWVTRRIPSGMRFATLDAHWSLHLVKKAGAWLRVLVAKNAAAAKRAAAKEVPAKDEPAKDVAE